MSELQIDNPSETISYSLVWSDIKNHILKVVATFPKEYSIVKNEINKIVILNIPINQENKAIAKDQLIYIDNETSDGLNTVVKILITNEHNQISSYTELERDKKSLNIFTILLKKSMNGTLGKSVANINAPKKLNVNTAQGIVQILLLIASIAAIFFGLAAILN